MHDCDNDGAHVLLCDLYAKLGRWDAVARTREATKKAAPVKESGYSPMELGGIVQEFPAGDAF